ncbi:MAG TPA: Os1348 family NHLP clan protein [Candidatus Polarisedimenticolia bacterium]|nr:Os1348 family NHLP clan protein [Candidatus Polarisedimenticolia bacterium]
MSQRSVERVVGRLVTDESFRRRFARDPAAALGEMAAEGADLNPCERQALLRLDPRALADFADRLDPRIQKTDLTEGCP